MVVVVELGEAVKKVSGPPYRKVGLGCVMLQGGCECDDAGISVLAEGGLGGNAAAAAVRD